VSVGSIVVLEVSASVVSPSVPVPVPVPSPPAVSMSPYWNESFGSLAVTVRAASSEPTRGSGAHPVPVSTATARFSITRPCTSDGAYR
jgi:hypothetical protein